MSYSENNRYKVITHNDLDGVVSGIVLTLSGLGSAYTDIEYIDANNVDDVVNKFLTSDEFTKYKALYITDLSIKDKDLAARLESLDLEVHLIDHHKTAEWLNEYKFAKVETHDSDGLMHSASSLILETLDLDNDESWAPFIKSLSHLTRLYDTWEWKKNPDNTDPLELNRIFQMLGIEPFVNMIYKMYMVGLGTDEIPCTPDSLISALKFRVQDIKDVFDYNREEYIAKKIKESRYIQNDNFDVVLTFMDRFISETADRILDEYLHDIHPVIYINLDYSSGVVNLRSRGDLSVADLADLCGGGGHTNAAGYTINTTSKEKLLMSDIHKFNAYINLMSGLDC